MEINDPSVPPGFRFHPTEEELVGYYLKRKINSLKIDLDVIVELDLYRMEPWDFRDRCKLGYEEQNEWYFFSHKDKKYPTGTRTNRATAAGFWKATGRDKAVLTKDNTMIGMRKTLVFYKGRAPNGRKTDWIMHEYRLQTTQDAPVQEEGWVVCRAFRKPSPATTHHMRPYYDGFEPAGFLNRNNIMDRRNQYCNNMTSMTMMMSRGSNNVHDSTNINGCPSPIPDLASPSSLMSSSSSTIDSNPIGGGSVFHHHYSRQDLIIPQQQQQNHQFYHQQQIKQSMFNSNNNNSDIMIPSNHQQLLPAAAADISSIPACSTSTTLVNQQQLMNRNTTTHNNTDDDWTGDAKTTLNWKFLDNLLTSDNNFIAPQPPPPTLLNEYNNNDLSDSFVCDHLAEIDHNDQLLGHYQPSFPNF